jgi:glutamate racemase
MIGVFDSGHGGLTILRALADRLPDRRFLYLGDHAHAPYGDRTPEDIYALTIENISRLFAHGCELVLLACNTAAAVALRRLQQEWLPHAYPGRRVLGVLVPTVEAVTQVPWHIKAPPPDAPRDAAVVAIFATRPTVESGAYSKEIGFRAPAIQVVQQACPRLVAAIESAAPESVMRDMVAQYVARLRGLIGGGVPDSAILGCTHYPLIAWAFAEALPPSVRILGQPAIVAESFAAYLARHPEFPPPPVPTANVFLTTGDPALAGALGSRFFGETIVFRAVSRARTPARTGPTP